ncbi:hypothetical protein COU59_02685 [Candidatus Pacearchaeota archaeon CG10_big_fil_rev_8_21_14_0_10_34_12]|nr:MAG: hypothetical protein COU59_02685 [Candidatus Pacearchaeota archaeon CG10_big_fil_rev_8_21_14_0_10_34_12]
MVQDTSIVKDKIISFIRLNGPSLPVHIASKIETSILFTSAFLSELLAEKRLKMSKMRVGSSPLYFIAGQEQGLEKFAQHLKSKEREAFILLKDKKFLKDSMQHPAIRVALREIRDFAIPFKPIGTEEIWWRFFTIPEKEFETPEKEEPKIISPIKEKIEQEIAPERQSPKTDKELGIFDDKKEEKPEKRRKTNTPKKKKSSKKKSATNEKFFNEVKEFLDKKSIELKDIIHFSKKEFVLLVNEGGSDKILFAFDKKKIGDKEISKAARKAQEMNLPYITLSKSGSLKKISDLIENLKNLDSLKSLDES